MSHFADTPITQLPWHTSLIHPLEQGQTLFVHGKIQPDATAFEINLLSGTPVISEHQGAVVLHLNVRLSEGKVVLNSLKVGDDFDLRIRIYAEHLEVLANQKALTEFKHRQDFKTIDNLEVKGDIILTGVHWGGRIFALPFETVFPGGRLGDDERVLVHGVPKGGRFEVDFMGANGEVLFHMNPRLKEKVIVRNAHLDGTWGSEEREGPFPFKKEQEFDLILENKNYSLQLFVNNQRIGTFAHRIQNPNEAYVRLRVDGEVELTGVEFGQKLSM